MEGMPQQGMPRMSSISPTRQLEGTGLMKAAHSMTNPNAQNKASTGHSPGSTGRASSGGFIPDCTSQPMILAKPYKATTKANAAWNPAKTRNHTTTPGAGMNHFP